jgi:beta-barrel assembly-enhancing protease
MQLQDARMTRAIFRIIFITSIAMFAAGLPAQQTIELPDFGDSAGSIISPQQERRLGEDFMRQMRRLAPMVTDEEIEDYINELGHSLSEHSDYEGTFEFFMLDSPVINAFALPGGFVVFHTGLMLETKSESELASVVGHEISHVSQRHTARMIEEASHMSVPMMVAMIGAIAAAAANPQMGAAALMATQAAAQQHQINFTRENEKEADAIGIRLMSKAAYDTNKMAVFFERMQRASRYSDPAFIPEYLRTHPITINRIAEARNRAETLKPAIVREDSYKYQLIKAKLRVRGEADPVQARHFYGSMLADGTYEQEQVARYGYALALTATGEFEKARIELDKLIAEYPAMVPFRIASGQLEQRANDYQAALRQFETAYKLEPESRAAVYGYINALLLVERYEQAKKLLRDYGLAERRDPKFYKMLAEAELGLGEKANSHHSLAEYYLSTGEHPLAAEQLRLARDTPGLTNYQRQKIIARLEEVEITIQKLDDEKRL